MQIFKSNNGLDITVEFNLKCTDFLDITLDLQTGKFYPFRKANNEPQYLNTQSNHPPSIIKQIPAMISARISENSCNKEEFDKAAPIYNKALAESGYSETITYVEAKPKKKRSRKRNIIWYNPPYSSNVKNNIGKEFFKLLDKHFPSITFTELLRVCDMRLCNVVCVRHVI